MPKVSVIIPTYNRTDTIVETIESVLRQRFTDFQLIIVDDGSTDDTASIIAGIADARVKYYYKKNGGVSSARNLGVAKARGQFVAFLDSDDFWPDNFLEVMTDKLDRNPDYGAAYCSRVIAFPDGRKIESYQKDFCKSGHLTVELFKKSFMQTSTICFRKQVLDGIFFEPSLSNAEDADVWLRVSSRTKFLFVPDVQIIYRGKPADAPSFSSNSCNRIRVLERFYFKLNGSKYISGKVAANKLSHAYKSVAKKSFQNNCRTASIYLYKKAIRYWPLDLRLYFGLMRAVFLKKSEDSKPDWQMPEPLPLPADRRQKGLDI